MIVNIKQWALLLCAVPLMVFGITLSGGEGEAAASLRAEPGPVIIIDAGHGGEDGGAVGVGGARESELNLAVASRLAALCGLCGRPCVMTRDSEMIDYPDSAATTRERKSFDQARRAALISGYPEGILVSIHQNCFPDPRPWGSQVLYGGTEGSRRLGELMHQMLTDSVCPGNRRVAAAAEEDIFLMRTAKCTSVLVECGFISNGDELSRLSQSGYQIKISAVLLAACLQYAPSAEVIR